MAYTRATLKQDLQALGVRSWDWGGAKPERLHPVLVRQNPNLAWGDMDPKEVLLEEITEYCWRAYQSARNTAGHLVIGRVKDLEAADLYRKVGDMVGDQTLFDDASAANLLKLDKWARVVNDSWILGGVHRLATFRLASPRIPQNLWDAARGYLIVTARELLGLLHFGYKLEQVGPWQVLVCHDQAAAANATLVEYDLLIKREGSVPEAAAALRQSVTGVVAPEKIKLPGPPVLAGFRR